ncbi:MAG: head GIN domain-containing protein [Ignavibacteria bacterium]|jgi:hypothetical protein|nr:head GIN domain-containing protein [Ignavibacteria bacterium]
MLRLFIPIVLLFVSGCSFITVTGGGNPTTRIYENRDFEKVSVSSGMKINIVQSDSYSIEVKAGEKTMKYLIVDQSGDKLKFYYSENRLMSRGDVFINISMPMLTEINLSGGSRGKIDMNIPDEKFSAGLSGGSAFKGVLNCSDIKMTLSGGSSSDLEGEGRDLYISTSGGSIFNLKNFIAEDVDTDMSGGSQGTVNLTGTLNTSQSGGSQLKYYGTATLGKTSFSGGSGISQVK